MNRVSYLVEVFCHHDFSFAASELSAPTWSWIQCHHQYPALPCGILHRMQFRTQAQLPNQERYKTCNPPSASGPYLTDPLASADPRCTCAWTWPAPSLATRQSTSSSRPSATENCRPCADSARARDDAPGRFIGFEQPGHVELVGSDHGSADEARTDRRHCNALVAQLDAQTFHVD